MSKSLQLQAQGQYMVTPWLDIVEPRNADFDADAVVSDVLARAGLEV
ncbi:MAG: hypothetical protein IJ586_00215 [Alloprevotella sp.]|nr:hypothetical protein [Alloprevotella sp.]